MIQTARKRVFLNLAIPFIFETALNPLTKLIKLIAWQCFNLFDRGHETDVGVSWAISRFKFYGQNVKVGAALAVATIALFRSGFLVQAKLENEPQNG